MEPTGSSSNTVPQGFLWRLSHVGMYDGLLTSISRPSSLCGEWRVGAESFKLEIMTWSFWGPVPIQKPANRCLLSPKDATVSQEMTRDLGALDETLLSLRKFQGF